MGEITLKEQLERITKDVLVNKMKIAGLRYTGLDKITIAGILAEHLQGVRSSLEENIFLQACFSCLAVLFSSRARSLRFARFSA